MHIKQMLSRVYVDNMDCALPFYEELSGRPCANRFKYEQAGLEIARIDNLLIIAGSKQALEPFRATSVTFLVDSLVDYRDFLLNNKAQIIRDMQTVPTGLNMTVKHEDGTIVEYVEHRQHANADA